MTAILAAALALAVLPQDTGRIPPAPERLLTPTWKRALVTADLLEWRPEEPGGPAVDAAHALVVAGTRDGVVRAFGDREGEPLWRFATQGASSTGARGFDASPLIDGGLVYAGSLDGSLYALDVFDGKQRWRYDAGEEIATTPVRVGELVVVATHQDSVVALDARTGAWKWTQRRERKGDRFTVRGVARPVLAAGLVFAGWSDGSVSALDAATGAPKWERLVAPPGEQVDVDGLATDGTRLFVVAYSGAVMALDPATGKTLWTESLPGASRLLVAGDLVIAVGTEQIRGLACSSGERRWERPFLGRPGIPTALGRRVAIPTGRGLLLLIPETGASPRTFDPGSGVSASPAVAGRQAFVVTNGGALVAFDLR